MIMLFDQEYAVKQFGMAQREEGREEGMEKKEVSNLRTLMERLKLSAEAAMDALAVPPEEREKYALKLKEAEKAEQYSAEG